MNLSGVIITFFFAYSIPRRGLAVVFWLEQVVYVSNSYNTLVSRRTVYQHLFPFSSSTSPRMSWIKNLSFRSLLAGGIALAVVLGWFWYKNELGHQHRPQSLQQKLHDLLMKIENHDDSSTCDHGDTSEACRHDHTSTHRLEDSPATRGESPFSQQGTMHGHVREYCQWAVASVCQNLLPLAEGLGLGGTASDKEGPGTNNFQHYPRVQKALSNIADSIAHLVSGEAFGEYESASSGGGPHSSPVASECGGFARETLLNNPVLNCRRVLCIETSFKAAAIAYGQTLNRHWLQMDLTRSHWQNWADQAVVNGKNCSGVVAGFLTERAALLREKTAKASPPDDDSGGSPEKNTAASHVSSSTSTSFLVLKTAGGNEGAGRPERITMGTKDSLPIPRSSRNRNPEAERAFLEVGEENHDDHQREEQWNSANSTRTPMNHEVHPIVPDDEVPISLVQRVMPPSTPTADPPEPPFLDPHDPAQKRVGPLAPLLLTHGLVHTPYWFARMGPPGSQINADRQNEEYGWEDYKFFEGLKELSKAGLTPLYTEAASMLSETKTIYTDEVHAVDQWLSWWKKHKDSPMPTKHPPRGVDNPLSDAEPGYEYSNMWSPLFQPWHPDITGHGTPDIHNALPKAWNSGDFETDQQREYRSYFSTTLDPCGRPANEPTPDNQYQWWPSTTADGGDPPPHQLDEAEAYWKRIAYLCPLDGKLFHAMYCVVNRLWEVQTRRENSESISEPSMGLDTLGVYGYSLGDKIFSLPPGSGVAARVYSRNRKKEQEVWETYEGKKRDANELVSLAKGLVKEAEAMFESVEKEFERWQQGWGKNAGQESVAGLEQKIADWAWADDASGTKQPAFPLPGEELKSIGEKSKIPLPWELWKFDGQEHQYGDADDRPPLKPARKLYARYRFSPYRIRGGYDLRVTAVMYGCSEFYPLPILPSALHRSEVVKFMCAFENSFGGGVSRVCGEFLCGEVGLEG